MSDQKQGDSDSIFDIEDNTIANDLVTESGASSKADETPKADMAIRNRNQQIKVWADRVEKGEVELNALPANLKWLKPFVEDEVNARFQSRDIDTLVEQKLARARAEERSKSEAKRFELLKAQANSIDADDSTKRAIQAKFEHYRGKGMSNADALEEALSTYETILKAGENATDEMKKRMQIPTKNKPVNDNVPAFGTEEFNRHGDSKSRVAEMEKLLRGR